MPTEHIDSADIGMTPEQERAADAAVDAILADRRTELLTGIDAATDHLDIARNAFRYLRPADPYLTEEMAEDITAYLDGTGRVLRTLVAVSERQVLAARVTELGQDLRAVYRERARLLAHLAATRPAVLVEADADDTGWPILYVDLPTGQASWHISPDDLDLFAHVERGVVAWDGHTTAEKYRRLDADTAGLAELHRAADHAVDEMGGE